MQNNLNGCARLVIMLLSASMLSAQPVDAGDPAPVETPDPPGRLVDIGGYRLHLWCTGEPGAGPAVVLIPGAGDFSFTWGWVQPAVAKFTCVCSFDAAGEAWSDPGPEPRTFKQQACELHLLLHAAGVKGPFVLVGASIGGIVARVFARDYRSEVAGMVLVDSTDPDTVLGMPPLGKLARIRESSRGRVIPPVQTMKSGPPGLPSAAELNQSESFLNSMGTPRIDEPHDLLPPELQKLDTWARFYQPRARLAAARRQLAAAKTDPGKAPAPGTPSPDAGLGWWPEEFQALYEYEQQKFPLGDMPLITLISSDPAKPVGQQKPKRSSDEEARILDEKAEQHVAQALLSSKGMYLKIESGHEIHLYQPAWVVEAIRQVVHAIRKPM